MALQRQQCKALLKKEEEMVAVDGKINYSQKIKNCPILLPGCQKRIKSTGHHKAGLVIHELSAIASIKKVYKELRPALS